MKELVGKRWFRIGTGSLLMLVLGFAVTAISTGAFGGTATSDFEVAFAYSTVPGGPQDLPLKVDEALTAGWNGTIRCHQSQGRFYRKLSGEDPDPMMLLFNGGGDLVGVNLYSANEQPSPWGHLPEGLLGVQGRQSDYWDLSIYFISPSEACATGTGGTSFVVHAIYP